MGTISGQNLPGKGNFQGLKGLAALTGKSNFDISEAIILRILESMQSRLGTVAMLCKTTVARKITAYAHKQNLSFSAARLIRLNSKQIFDVSVDACLFMFSTGAGHDYTCIVQDSLQAPEETWSRFGFIDGRLVADVRSYAQTRDIEGTSSVKWRSGIKHDCSGAMEMRREGTALINGLGEPVDVESKYVFPLLKSSDLTKPSLPLKKRAVIVTQKSIAEDTLRLRSDAPKLWAYLSARRALFEKRKSSIYRGKPPFSMFGIGDYSFAPWKVAISGLYKTSKFSIVPPVEGKPVMLDDTCYFLPCNSEREAEGTQAYLNSKKVQDFIHSIAFWDSKRPINAEILQRISLDEISGQRAAPAHRHHLPSRNDAVRGRV